MSRLAKRPALTAFGAGALAALGHLLPYLWPVIPFAVAGLLIALRETNRPYRTAFLFAIAFFCPNVVWLGQFVGRWSGPSVGLLVIVVVTLGMSLQLAVIGPVAKRSLAAGRWWIIPLAWAAIEGFRAYVPVFAFPYALIAHPMWTTPWLAQPARLVTEVGMGAWLVAIGCAVHLRPKPRFYAALAAPAVLSLVMWVLTPRQTLGLKVAAGQIGIDMSRGTAVDQRFAIAREGEAVLIEAKAQGAGLAVLAEGLVSMRGGLAAPFPLPEGLNVVFGGQRPEGEQVYQTAFAWDGRWHSADKTRLVIMGEFVPFRGIVPYPESFRLPGGDLSAAPSLALMTVGGRRIGSVLCFEALFPDVPLRQRAAGAELLTVLSLDDWFAGTTAIEALKGASVWRAIETGRPIVRAGSLGKSCIISPRGEILVEAPFGRRAVVTADL